MSDFFENIKAYTLGDNRVLVKTIQGSYVKDNDINKIIVRSPSEFPTNYDNYNTSVVDGYSYIKSVDSQNPLTINISGELVDVTGYDGLIVSEDGYTQYRGVVENYESTTEMIEGATIFNYQDSSWIIGGYYTNSLRYSTDIWYSENGRSYYIVGLMPSYYTGSAWGSAVVDQNNNIYFVEGKDYDTGVYSPNIIKGYVTQIGEPGISWESAYWFTGLGEYTKLTIATDANKLFVSEGTIDYSTTPAIDDTLDTFGLGEHDENTYFMWEEYFKTLVFSNSVDRDKWIFNTAVDDILVYPHAVDNLRLLDYLPGIDQLDASLTINGTTVTPNFRYKGGDAGPTKLSFWEYGSSIGTAGSGTAPSYNQGSPGLESNDDSFKLNAGTYYQDGGSELGDIATEDIVFEIVFKYIPVATTESIITHGDATPPGWLVYVDSFDRIIFRFSDSSPAAVNHESSASSLVDGTWNHCMCFGDRSGSAQWYVNGVASGAPDSIAALGSLTSGDSLTVGARNNGSVPSNQQIAYIAMWKYDNWLDTHLQADVAAERFAKLTGIYPSVALGTALPDTATRPSAAFTTRIESGITKLYNVGTNWLRVGQRLDLDGTTFSGYLCESSISNICLQSQTFDTTWTLTDSDDLLADGYSVPDKSTTGWGLTPCATTGNHGVEQVITLGKANYCFSVWVKYTGNVSHLYLADEDEGNTYGYFDIQQGSLGTLGADTDSSYIEPWGDDWYRCCIIYSTNGGNHSMVIKASNVENLNFSGDGITPAFYIWGAQVEITNNYMTSYIPTTTSDESRGLDYLKFTGTANIGVSGSEKHGKVYCNMLQPNCDLADTPAFFSLSDGLSVNNDIKLFTNVTPDSTSFRVVSGGVQKLSSTGTTDVFDGYSHSIETKHTVGTCKVFVDGSENSSANADDIPDDLDTVLVATDIGYSSFGGLINNFIIQHEYNDIGSGDMFLHQQDSSSTSWVVNHNIGNTNYTVVCFDSNEIPLEPASITKTSATLTITFNAAVSGYCYVLKDAVYKTGSTWSLDGYHYDYDQWVVTNEDGVRLAPASWTTSGSTLSITFNASQTGWIWCHPSYLSDYGQSGYLNTFSDTGSTIINLNYHYHPTLYHLTGGTSDLFVPATINRSTNTTYTFNQSDTINFKEYYGRNLDGYFINQTHWGNSSNLAFGQNQLNKNQVGLYNDSWGGYSTNYTGFNRTGAPATEEVDFYNLSLGINLPVATGTKDGYISRSINSLATFTSYDPLATQDIRFYGRLGSVNIDDTYKAFFYPRASDVVWESSYGYVPEDIIDDYHQVYRLLAPTIVSSYSAGAITISTYSDQPSIVKNEYKNNWLHIKDASDSDAEYRYKILGNTAGGAGDSIELYIDADELDITPTTSDYVQVIQRRKNTNLYYRTINRKVPYNYTIWYDGYNSPTDTEKAPTQYVNYKHTLLPEPINTENNIELAEWYETQPLSFSELIHSVWNLDATDDLAAKTHAKEIGFITDGLDAKLVREASKVWNQCVDAYGGCLDGVNNILRIILGCNTYASASVVSEESGGVGKILQIDLGDGEYNWTYSSTTNAVVYSPSNGLYYMPVLTTDIDFDTREVIHYSLVHIKPKYISDPIPIFDHSYDYENNKVRVWSDDRLVETYEDSISRILVMKREDANKLYNAILNIMQFIPKWVTVKFV